MNNDIINIEKEYIPLKFNLIMKQYENILHQLQNSTNNEQIKYIISIMFSDSIFSSSFNYFFKLFIKNIKHKNKSQALTYIDSKGHLIFQYIPIWNRLDPCQEELGLLFARKIIELDMLEVLVKNSYTDFRIHSPLLIIPLIDYFLYKDKTHNVLTPLIQSIQNKTIKFTQLSINIAEQTHRDLPIALSLIYE